MMKMKLLGATVLALACLVSGTETAKENQTKGVLLEVLRHSWGAEREETLVYLRVYSDGFAEAHPMTKVDFRHIEFHTKQLSSGELAALRNLLSDPATAKIAPQQSRYWGNKDFGDKYDVKIAGTSQVQEIELLNFQPFLARKQGKPYSKQVEKLGCTIWRLRAEVSGEPLEKNWLTGCTELGY